jgi:hypothetical protein
VRFGILLLEALPERSNHFRKPVSFPGIYHLFSARAKKNKKRKRKKKFPQSDCNLPENV